jgi:fluoride ion exporter CrcB/FEX
MRDVLIVAAGGLVGAVVGLFVGVAINPDKGDIPLGDAVSGFAGAAAGALVGAIAGAAVAS